MVPVLSCLTAPRLLLALGFALCVVTDAAASSSRRVQTRKGTLAMRGPNYSNGTLQNDQKCSYLYTRGRALTTPINLTNDISSIPDSILQRFWQRRSLITHHTNTPNTGTSHQHTMDGDGAASKNVSLIVCRHSSLDHDTSLALDCHSRGTRRPELRLERCRLRLRRPFRRLQVHVV